MTENDLTQWIGKEEKTRLDFLSKSWNKCHNAVKSHKLEFNIIETNEVNDPYYKWRVKVVDNIGGASLLHIPSYELAKEMLPHADSISYPGDWSYNEDGDKITKNRVVNFWEKSDSGYDFGDGVSGGGYPSFIQLFEPRAYIFHKPNTFLEIYLRFPEDAKPVLLSLRERISNSWGSEGLLSALNIEYNSIINLAREKKEISDSRIQQKKSDIVDKKKMGELLKQKF